jgi:hypothetical protein
MSAIDRPAIESNVGQIAVAFELLLGSIVARRAKGLQRPGAERGQVTSVGLNVVDSIG